MLPREPSWREEEKGEERFTQGAATSCQRKADNLIGQNAATAETHLEKFGDLGGEKGSNKFLTQISNSEMKFAAALAHSELYTTLFQRGKQYFKRRHNNYVLQEQEL